MRILLLVIFSLGLLGGMDYIVQDQEPPQMISAHVNVQLECELDPSVFIVRDLSTNQFYPLRNSQATFTALEGTRMQLQLHPDFKKVDFNGPKFLARSEQNLFATCYQGRLPSFLRRAIGS